MYPPMNKNFGLQAIALMEGQDPLFIALKNNPMEIGENPKKLLRTLLVNLRLVQMVNIFISLIIM